MLHILAQAMVKTARVGCLVLGLLYLAGCTNTAPTSTQPAGNGSLPGQAVSSGVSDPELVRLWQEADIALALKNYDKATHFLEEAISRAPEHPVLWSRVAEVQLLAGQPVLAENFAAKSISLAPQNTALVYRNWRIIMEARVDRKDTEGIAEARKELQKLAPDQPQ